MGEWRIANGEWLTALIRYSPFAIRVSSYQPEMRLIPSAMEIRQRRRAPDIGLAALPGFRPLRRVLMPGPRLEIAEALVHHLVELAEEFDHLIVRIAVIGGDVVARPVAQRAPDDRNLALAEQVAGILQVDEILQLEGHVVHFDII